MWTEKYGYCAIVHSARFETWIRVFRPEDYPHMNGLWVQNALMDLGFNLIGFGGFSQDTDIFITDTFERFDYLKKEKKNGRG